MRISLICAFAILFGPAPIESFSFGKAPAVVTQAHPSVKEYAESQTGQLIQVHLDIGKVSSTGAAGISPKVTGSHLGISKILLELNGDQDATYPHPKLPGIDGPNPQLSTGAKSMTIHQKGHYIDLTGTQQVNLDNGAWELIWRHDAPAGAIICGFDVPQDIRRNDAILPSGKVYVTFPVWTTQSLQNLRDLKAWARKRALEAMDREKEELRKMEETNNLLMKALHYRNACKANEELDYSGHHIYSSMPVDGDMIELECGLHLCGVGTVWTKEGEEFGGDHILLGSASARPGRLEERVEEGVDGRRNRRRSAYDGLFP